MRRHFTLLSLVIVGLVCAGRCRADGALAVTCEKPDGVYNVGQTIRWNVRWTGPGAIASADYSVKLGGRTEAKKGKLSFINGACAITATLDRPDTILVEITADSADGTQNRAVGGAVAAPDKIFPAAACPPDFDAFWDAKVRQLHAVPPNPRLLAVDSEKPGVDYWKITMDNVRGIHVQGQIARPKNGEKFPALLIPQWAGVYGLEKSWVTDRAAEGWLALDISAHDIPIDQPKAFYKSQFDGPLKNYWAIGNDDRDKSYFLPMYLSCYQAAEYLQSRPDWDGKTLVVSGGSQGGQQAIMIAGLYPHFTAVLAIRPSGGDMRAPESGRAPGWPMWYDWTEGKDPEKVHHASEYYDPANFAPRINCPVLVGVGLLDEVAAPSSIFAVFNRIISPKEIVIMPNATHPSEGETSKGYYTRWGLWMWNLRQGNPAPIGR
ncbi:MAG: acetylxylan esterase [Tepidisphaeraceae bacterium]|jgi:cephalosporin-C deacetylase-like acetyl esterase